MMTLQQLKYILTIVSCGSISEAAKQLYISQPSLSSEPHVFISYEHPLAAVLTANSGFAIIRFRLLSPCHKY
jgi:hypothetical protein